MREKALELAVRVKNDDFKASKRSKGWFECFKARNGIAFFRQSDDEAAVSDWTIEEWIKQVLLVVFGGLRTKRHLQLRRNRRVLQGSTQPHLKF